MKWPKRQEIWLSEGTALVNRVWASMTLSNTSCLQYSEVKKHFYNWSLFFWRCQKRAKLLQNKCVHVYILQTSLHFVSFLIWQNIFSQCNHETAIFDGTDQVYVLWLWHFVCYFMLILSVTVWDTLAVMCLEPAPLGLEQYIRKKCKKSSTKLSTRQNIRPSRFQLDRKPRLKALII